MTPDEWADFLERRADGLRQRGLLSIGIDGLSATFSAYIQPPSTDDVKGEDVKEPRNVWDDPASYPNGEVPGFRIEKFDVED